MTRGKAGTEGRRVSRQREAGEATRRESRRRLLVAARAEFAERGYAAATVVRIAPPAGGGPGPAPAAAAAPAGATATPGPRDQLVRQAGYSYDQLEAWTRATLAAALFPDR